MLLGSLQKEYFAILEVVSQYDGRFMLVKGWSVTLSLASLGLGFQQRHYSLFALGAITALSFWYLDALLKGHQMRYYSRMRDIEVASHALNNVQLRDLSEVSAPRIDSYWEFTGKGPDSRNFAPTRRSAKSIRRQLWMKYLFPHVMLPHVVAVILGFSFFVAARSDGWDLSGFTP